MTITIPVAWWSPAQDQPTPARGFWDQGWLEEVLAAAPPGVSLDHLIQPPSQGGAIVVIPARWNIDKIEKIQEAISKLDWVLLVLTGDEEGSFPRELLRHNNMIVWVQTPSVVHEGERGVGDAAPPAMRDLLPERPPHKTVDWMFAGQINNSHRLEMQMELQDLPGGSKLFTQIFGSGFEYKDYVEEMLAAKVVPCPGGNFTPDTFRLFEALEAGAVPVVHPGSEPYWLRVYGEMPPFIFSSKWEHGIRLALQNWRDNAARAQCWWANQRRREKIDFWQHVHQLSGIPVAVPATTVLVPTSSSPADPNTDIFEHTMGSIRERFPTQEIIVMMDGLHSDHEMRRDKYAEYRRRVAWLTIHKYNGLPLFFEEHTHQAEMTRQALLSVRTPIILFVEHDTPLIDDWPVGQLEAVILNGHADYIRMHHEDRVLMEHEYLMRSPVVFLNSQPMRKTVQWSQRPHFARTASYADMLNKHFTMRSRTMIEDAVHGPAQNETYWPMKMYMYHPSGSIKRSTHLDGRAGEPKVEMIF